MAKSRAAGTDAQKRRRYTRVPCRVTVSVTESESDGFLLFATANLSMGGTFLESDLLLEVGSLVRLAFRLPNSKNPTVVEGVVVRVADEDSLGRSQPGMGLEFTRMDGISRRALEDYLKSNLSSLGEDASGH